MTIYLPKLYSGIKNAPIIPPMMSRYFMPQKPFWIPARKSLEDLTFIIIIDMSKKKSVTTKQSLKMSMVFSYLRLHEAVGVKRQN